MKLKYVDSIRGLAILMVIFGHIGQEIRGLTLIPHLLTSYGQMGVQLFFVASAYTLCMSATNRENELQPLKKYAIRRFFRIAPMYYLGLIGYFIVALLIAYNKTGILNIPYEYSFINVVTNVIFVHGFYPPANNNIVPGGWSIGTEMAFYVIFPFLFYFGKKIVGSSLKRGFLMLLTVFTFSQLLLILIYYSIDLRVEDNNFLYYNLVHQLPVFCVGIIYYLVENNNKFKTNYKLDLLFFILLTLLSLTIWNSEWSYKFSLIPFISAVSFSFLINIFKKVDGLNFKFLAKIGTVSYSMYILHFVLLNFSGIASRHVMINKNILLIILFIITVLVAFILALISEKYVEKPFMEMGKKIIQKL